MPGISFTREPREPSNDVYAGKKCDGVKIEITDKNTVRSLDIFIHAACILRDINKDDFKIKWKNMKDMTGNEIFQALYESNASPEVIISALNKEAEQFRQTRAKYLLY